jgi:hypothetical protein
MSESRAAREESLRVIREQWRAADEGRWIANELRYLEKGSDFLSRARAKRIAQDQDQLLATLQELNYCVREFRREIQGMDPRDQSPGGG